MCVIVYMYVYIDKYMQSCHCVSSFTRLCTYIRRFTIQIRLQMYEHINIYEYMNICISLSICVKVLSKYEKYLDVFTYVCTSIPINKYIHICICIYDVCSHVYLYVIYTCCWRPTL